MTNHNFQFSSPPDNFYKSVTPDKEFEDNFTVCADCTGTEIRSSEKGVTTSHYTCTDWDAYVYKFDSSKTYLPKKYSRLQRSYKLCKNIGLRTPAHQFGDEYIATKAIPQGGKPGESTLLHKTGDVDTEKLERLLLKNMLFGCRDVSLSNIVVDKEGTPYTIDFALLNDIFRLYEANRRRMIKIFDALGRGEDAIELFEARLFSLLTYFPRSQYRYTNYMSPDGPESLSTRSADIVDRDYNTVSRTRNSANDWMYLQGVHHGLLVHLPQNWGDLNPLSVDIWEINYDEYAEIKQEHSAC